MKPNDEAFWITRRPMKECKDFYDAMVGRLVRVIREADPRDEVGMLGMITEVYIADPMLKEQRLASHEANLSWFGITVILSDGRIKKPMLPPGHPRSLYEFY